MQRAGIAGIAQQDQIARQHRAGVAPPLGQPGHAQRREQRFAAIEVPLVEMKRILGHLGFMVAGSGRFDTRLMERLGARAFCKVGAEGVYCAALPELGLGVAIKIDDGNNARACEVVMAALIERLLPLADDEAVFMRKRERL